MEERFIKSPHTKLADANMLIKKEEKKNVTLKTLNGFSKIFTCESDMGTLKNIWYLNLKIIWNGFWIRFPRKQRKKKFHSTWILSQGKSSCKIVHRSRSIDLENESFLLFFRLYIFFTHFHLDISKLSRLQAERISCKTDIHTQDLVKESFVVILNMQVNLYTTQVSFLLWCYVSPVHRYHQVLAKPCCLTMDNFSSFDRNFLLFFESSLILQFSNLAVTFPTLSVWIA